MAIYKLGNVAELIAGSIGGTTFKRSSTNPIITNKSNGGSRFTLLHNARLNAIARIFKLWSRISAEQRQSWRTKTMLYQFPDKFGVLRNLTPRQFFIKQNIQLLRTGTEQLDASLMVNDIEPFGLQGCFINPFIPYLILNKTGSNRVQTFVIQATLSRNKIITANDRRTKSFFTSQSSTGASIDIWTEFITAYPFYDNSYNVGLTVSVINEWGFTSSSQFVQCIQD